MWVLPFVATWCLCQTIHSAKPHPDIKGLIQGLHLNQRLGRLHTFDSTCWTLNKECSCSYLLLSPYSFSFLSCIHWQFSQVSLVTVVYIPSWLELQKCKWAPCECILSVVAEMALLRWGAGGRTSCVHGDPPAPRPWRSQQRIEELFFGLKHPRFEIRTHYCERVSHRQAVVCQLLRKTKCGKEQGKGQTGSNSKAVLYQSSRFVGRTSPRRLGWSVAAVQALEGQAHSREVPHLLSTREYFDTFSVVP